MPGAADVKVEQVSGLPLLTVAINRDVLARYGLQIGAVQDAIVIATGGKKVASSLRAINALIW